jgi:small-conductance mechanosensitive channel
MRKPFRQMLLALFASVLTWELIQSIQLPAWITRDVLAILSVVVMILFWGQSRAASRNPDGYKRPASIPNRAVHVGLVLMLVSLFANVLGFFSLSRLIGNGTLVSGYRAVGLYTVFVAGTSIVAFALQTNLVRRLAVVRGNAERIARGISVVLSLLTFGVWLHTTLSLFGIRADVYQAVRAGFAYKVTLGTVSFAPGNIVVFLLTLFFGYMIASMASSILGHEILPRLNLERGLPDAITTITRYVSLVVIFLLALAVGGVELSRFSLLTGAFGVGIGFGLQNVVNNFLSGLILLFERPVRIGDSLEVGGVSGEVTKIGFRSSTLHSSDGSDLIIPNANLISQQVINWTLSGTRRRVSLRVHVAHGNDPEYVRDLLLATAASHPDVLKSPAPTALFLGFGESALDEICGLPGKDVEQSEIFFGRRVWFPPVRGEHTEGLPRARTQRRGLHSADAGAAILLLILRAGHEFARLDVPNNDAPVVAERPAASAPPSRRYPLPECRGAGVEIPPVQEEQRLMVGVQHLDAGRIGGQQRDPGIEYLKIQGVERRF